MIANRTVDRSTEMASELAGDVVTYESIQDALGEVDIAIVATDAPEYIVSRDMVERSLAASPSNRTLFIFDLAVPRDVEPSAGELQGVRLFNIDDLGSIASENRPKSTERGQGRRADSPG